MTAPTVPPEVDEVPPAASSRRRITLRGLLDRRPRHLSAGPAAVGAAAAAWAVAIGLALAVIPMLVAWIASPTTGLTWQEALRIAGTVWSVAQTAPVTIAGVTYSLTPWGLAILATLLVAHGGRWALRRCEPGRSTVVMVVAAAVAYALMAAVVGFVSGNALADVSPSAVGVRGLGVAVLGLLLAAGLEGRLGELAVPAWLSVGLRAGLVAVAVVVAVAAIGVGIVLAMRLDDAATMLANLHAGLGGGLVVLALGLGYVPVLISWAVSYILGAGVVLGPAVTASPFIEVTSPTLLPPFPLLAAVPESASPLAWALPAVGVVAGVVAGIVVARGARREPRAVRAGVAVLAVAVSSVVLAVAMWLSSGSLGDLRLAHVGASPSAVAVLAAITMVLGAVPAAVIPGEPGRARRRLRVAPVADTPEPPDSASLAPSEPTDPVTSDAGEADPVSPNPTG